MPLDHSPRALPIGRGGGIRTRNLSFMRRTLFPDLSYSAMRLVSLAGLEPATFCLENRCSDSTELQARKQMEAMVRFELTTSWLRNSRSTSWSYIAISES